MSLCVGLVAGLVKEGTNDFQQLAKNVGRRAQRPERKGKNFRERNRFRFRVAVVSARDQRSQRRVDAAVGLAMAAFFIFSSRAIGFWLLQIALRSALGGARARRKLPKVRIVARSAAMHIGVVFDWID
jgi:hypothetical protein